LADEVFESTAPSVFDEGDNICASPRGQGLIIAKMETGRMSMAAPTASAG
jgi:hypothetical protein